MASSIIPTPRQGYKTVEMTYETPTNINTNYSWMAVNETTRHAMIQIYHTGTLSTSGTIATVPSSYAAVVQTWSIAFPAASGSTVARAMIAGRNVQVITSTSLSGFALKIDYYY